MATKRGQPKARYVEEHYGGNDQHKIDALEVEFAGMESRLTGLEKAMTGGFDSVGRQLTQMAATLQRAQQVPWGHLAAWGSIIILVLGAFGQMAMERFADRISSMENELSQREELVPQIAVLHERVVNLDRSLTRDLSGLEDLRNRVRVLEVRGGGQ